MKFASSYEPNQYEADIYGAWEAAGIFDPKLTTKPVDDDGDGIDDRVLDRNTYSIVMPPPNANGNLHIGHGLTVALEDSLTRYYRLRGASSWYIPGADHAGFLKEADGGIIFLDEIVVFSNILYIGREDQSYMDTIVSSKRFVYIAVFFFYTV